MKIHHLDNDVLELSGSYDEFKIIAQSLNEVIGGAPANAYVPGERFLSIFGISVEDADKVHGQLIESLHAEKNIINCSETTLVSLHNIMQYCLKHIEDDEYSTVMGFDKGEARALLRALH